MRPARMNQMKPKSSKATIVGGAEEERSQASAFRPDHHDTILAYIKRTKRTNYVESFQQLVEYSTNDILHKLS